MNGLVVHTFRKKDRARFGPVGLLGVEERERVFRRLYRLDRSRATPGSGLDLSLMAATAKLRDAGVSLEDDDRSDLEVAVTFAQGARP